MMAGRMSQNCGNGMGQVFKGTKQANCRDACRPCVERLMEVGHVDSAQCQHRNVDGLANVGKSVQSHRFAEFAL